MHYAILNYSWVFLIIVFGSFIFTSGLTAIKILEILNLTSNKIIFSYQEMQSFNLFPTEDTQTLKTEQLKTNFAFGSYSSFLDISNESKKLHIQLDNKQIKKDIVSSFQMLSATYSVDKEYLTEVFKVIINKIEESKDDNLKDELAAYLVNNLNTSEKFTPEVK